jgi:hypothetical protein
VYQHTNTHRGTRLVLSFESKKTLPATLPAKILFDTMGKKNKKSNSKDQSSSDYDSKAVLKGFRESVSNVMSQSTQQLVNENNFENHGKPLNEIKAQIRDSLKRHGTNVDMNDADPTGDGDQSPVRLDHSGKQVYRDLFAAGM